MDRRRFLAGLASGVFLARALAAPRPLRVGVEACPYCFMTILDARHAAQAVNPQGKAFFYDDPACLLDQLNGWGGPSLVAKEVYLADYAESSRTAPKWVAAEKALLYHNPRIRTPMGSGLLAFGSQEALERHLKERPERAGGRVLTWAEALKEGKKRTWVPTDFFPPPPKAP
ncbi:nitrous oxide reductase accessory protein NosL [Thermus tenuipuniceus]|uniref:nitrous oxide reductase accessory protein NosL n=1 Tax=Thermus tenuipuniceus TaxID=2078690 RepID=UPI000CF8CF60|nr:nitrous oxide reductase accessory protein NosL [Thermus tenuipuniceus]